MSTATPLDLEKLGQLVSTVYEDIEANPKEPCRSLDLRRGAHLLGLLKKEGLEVHFQPRPGYALP